MHPSTQQDPAMTSRRDFLSTTSLAATGLALSPLAACSRETASAPAGAATSQGAPAIPAVAAGPMLTRAIPSSGEMLPVIGAGTSGSYEVRLGSPEFETLKDVVRIF